MKMSEVNVRILEILETIGFLQRVAKINKCSNNNVNINFNNLEHLIFINFYKIGIKTKRIMRHNNSELKKVGEY